MPRHRRISPDNFVQHVVNRGDHRETIFRKPGDFQAFLVAVAETAYCVSMRILAYCIMRNHFHLLLWPQIGDDLPVFMERLMNTHIRRYTLHYPPASPGHIYQGRYHNSIVETGPDLLNVARYVEANALSAGLVERAEHYCWSSASPQALDANRPVLSEWPIPKPANWLKILNTPTPADELKKIQRSIQRGAPIGSSQFVDRMAAAYRLEHTLRPRGRPRVYETELPTE